MIEDSSIQSSSPFAEAVTKGLMAAKQNRIPGLLMCLFGIALIIGYYQVPPVHRVLDQVGEIKTRWGWVFSMISTAIFGGAIPVLITWLLKQQSSSGQRELLISSTLLWAYKGIETDYFYRFQAWMFGEAVTLPTVMAKLVVDLLIWVPCWSLLNVVLFYIWRDCGYSFSRLQAELGQHWYRRRILPVLIANNAVWAPAVLVIYSLPVALQLPIQNLILCFWILILIFFTNEKR